MGSYKEGSYDMWLLNISVIIKQHPNFADKDAETWGIGIMCTRSQSRRWSWHWNSGLLPPPA